MAGILCAIVGASGGPVIQLTTPVSLSYASGGIFAAYTGYRVDSDSYIYTTASFNAAYIQAEQWNSDPSTVANYEVRATLDSGTSPSGSALGTWLDLSVDRGWELMASAGNLFTCSLTVEIRDTATSTVRATASVTLDSNAT